MSPGADISEPSFSSSRVLKLRHSLVKTSHQLFGRTDTGHIGFLKTSTYGLKMSHSATDAAALRGSAQPLAGRDEPECSPPPYPYYERQLSAQSLGHVNQLAEDPPEYNYYDVEGGSWIDTALAHYAQSITPNVASTRYTILEQDDPATLQKSDFSSRLRTFLFYCMAIFCGVTWALFWVCAIGFAIVTALKKISEGLG